MTTETLVKPANAKEQLLGKISEMRQKNQTAKQKEEIEFHERRLIDGFKKFSWRYFGVNKEQIQELSDQEIEALFLLVSELARKTAVYMRILGISIPLVGWIAILQESETIQFANSMRKLKKTFGNSFNPVRIIRAGLK